MTYTQLNIRIFLMFILAVGIFEARLYLRTGYLGKAKACIRGRTQRDLEAWHRKAREICWIEDIYCSGLKKTHITKATCILQGCSAAQLCLMGLPACATRSHTTQQGFIWAGGLLGCKTKAVKKKQPVAVKMQEKSHDVPRSRLYTMETLHYGKLSHLAGWPTPSLLSADEHCPGPLILGAPARRAVVVGTACVPAAQWEEITIMHGRSLLHFS